MPNIKPILFNGDMVRALLDNRKTVTRRVVKGIEGYINCDCGTSFVYDSMADAFYCMGCGYPLMADRAVFLKPPYRPGDILYVRETFRIDYLSNVLGSGRIHYKADDSYADFSFSVGRYEMMRRAQIKPGWRPNESMPREAARIFLRVTNVRVERLQDITEAEILQDTGEVQCTEGYDWFKDEFKVVPYSEKFKFLLRAVWGRYWDEHIVKMKEEYIWEANPWVWVIEFERISKEEAYGECK